MCMVTSGHFISIKIFLGAPLPSPLVLLMFMWLCDCPYSTVQVLDIILQPTVNSISKSAVMLVCRLLLLSCAVKFLL